VIPSTKETAMHIKAPCQRAALWIVLSLACHGPVAAQWMGADYAAWGAPASSFGSASFLNATILNGGSAKGKKSGTHSAAPLPHLQAPGQGLSAQSLQQLSTRFPPERRARAEKAFKDAFATYSKLESKLDLPRQDLGVAMAAFIAGNYMALHDKAVPDDHFRHLAHQMRRALSSNAALKRASAGERRALYEQFATIGTFMAIAQLEFQRQPNLQAQEKFQETARQQLEQLLNTPADRVRITRTGLSLG